MATTHKSLVDMSNLESAIALSVQSHRREQGKNGYWFDAISGDTFGSSLWTLRQKALGLDAAAIAAEYVREALQHLPQSKSLDVEVHQDGEILFCIINGDQKEIRFEL